MKTKSYIKILISINTLRHLLIELLEIYIINKNVYGCFICLCESDYNVDLYKM